MAYIAPIPKNGVSFTNNLNETNRKNGEYLLGYYFRASKLAKPPYYPITNFKGLLAFLDINYPTYIEALGELMKTVPQDKLIEAMKMTAARGLTDYPRPAYFSSTLLSLTGYSVVGVIGQSVKEAAVEVVGYAALFSKIVIFGALIGGSLFLYYKAGGKFPMVKL